MPRGDWKIFGEQFGQGGLCGTNTYLNYDACDRLEQQEFAANTVHQLNVFFTNRNHETDLANSLTVGSSTFNYSPYNYGWLYGEGTINTTQNPNYPWATCLTTYYMDQYEIDIWVMIYSNHTNSGWQRSVFMSANDVIVGIIHPRLYSQLNNFMQ